MSINFIGAVWDSGLYDGPRLLMMLALADHADADGWCFPNYDTLALKIRRNVKTVYRVLSELESDGAIKRLDGRIGICEPHILEEVKRRAESRRAKHPSEPAETILNSENTAPKNGTAATPPILNNENGILNSENGVLTSETPILNSETPFFIDPSSDPSLTRQEPATAPPAAKLTQPAAAAADPLAPILDWIGFDDTLKPQERRALTVADLLASAYWVYRKRAEAGSRVYNAVGLMRSQWRNGKRPSNDYLRLARGWLALDDDGRRRLLDRLEWANDYSGHLDGDDFERDFPYIPPTLAAAVYTATGGAFGPPSLMPPPAPPPDPAVLQPPAARPALPSPTPSTASTLWRDALAELEMQMTRATFATWLAGTTATLKGDELVVHVRSTHAVDWLENRLHTLIVRTVTNIAGRPLTVHYRVPELEEAHP